MALIQRNFFQNYDLRKFREGIDCKTDHCGAIGPRIRKELEEALIKTEAAWQLIAVGYYKCCIILMYINLL